MEGLIMMLLFFITLFALSSIYIGEVLIKAACERWGDHLNGDLAAVAVCHVGAMLGLGGLLILCQMLIEAL
jgi:hypothetical protein